MGKDVIERSTGMMAAGYAVGRHFDGGEITQVVLVMEGWMSPPRQDFVRPSQDPNRLAVLLISAIDPQTEEQVGEAYACVREKNQALVALKRVSLPDAATVKSPLL